MQTATRAPQRKGNPEDRRAGPIIKQGIAIFVLARVSASLALILLEGASVLLEGAVVGITVAGLAPLGVIIRAIGSKSLPARPMRRDERPGPEPRALPQHG